MVCMVGGHGNHRYVMGWDGGVFLRGREGERGRGWGERKGVGFGFVCGMAWHVPIYLSTSSIVIWVSIYLFISNTVSNDVHRLFDNRIYNSFEFRSLSRCSLLFSRCFPPFAAPLRSASLSSFAHHLTTYLRERALLAGYE